VIDRIGDTFELVLIESAYLIEDRRPACRLGFGLELAA
jgi:hypothetical protein